MNSPYMAWGNVKILNIIERNVLSTKMRWGRLATQPHYHLQPLKTDKKNYNNELITQN